MNKKNLNCVHVIAENVSVAKASVDVIDDYRKYEAYETLLYNSLDEDDDKVTWEATNAEGALQLTLKMLKIHRACIINGRLSGITGKTEPGDPIVLSMSINSAYQKFVPHFTEGSSNWAQGMAYGGASSTTDQSQLIGYLSTDTLTPNKILVTVDSEYWDGDEFSFTFSGHLFQFI